MARKNLLKQWRNETDPDKKARLEERSSQWSDWRANPVPLAPVLNHECEPRRGRP